MKWAQLLTNPLKILNLTGAMNNKPYQICFKIKTKKNTLPMFAPYQLSGTDKEIQVNSF